MVEFLVFPIFEGILVGGGSSSQSIRVYVQYCRL